MKGELVNMTRTRRVGKKSNPWPSEPGIPRALYPLSYENSSRKVNSPTLFTYQRKDDLYLPSLNARLCLICYEYCGIRRSRLSLVSLQIADWLPAEMFENGVLKVCGKNSTKSSSMVLTELVRLFDSSTKSTIVYVFIVPLTDHRH